MLLALNYLCFQSLRNYVGGDWLVIERTPFTAANVILMCLMPAVFEEVFFRYLALDSLRRIIGPRSAVFVTAAMFALAHLYNPLGIPYLFLVGVVLGGIRASGGGLLLPMVLHFLHNYAVCFSEAFA
jgi:membrane protease YdiL (CAAX protease family)